jgi:very-short-patch-repair endonuclease
VVCSKQIGAYQHNVLCASCAGKKKYAKRGKFTHKNGKFFTDSDLEFLKANYADNTKDFLSKVLNRSWCSITHKAHRLRLKRNPKFLEEGHAKGTAWFKANNPMKNPISKEKARQSLVKLYRDNPDKLLNARLKRNQMTGIEKKIADYLDSKGISYEWNKYVKTRTTWRFPDFRIKDLVIECDGLYWHNKQAQSDAERENELKEIGLRVIRFNDVQILKQFDEVRKHIDENLKEVIWSNKLENKPSSSMAST